MDAFDFNLVHVFSATKARDRESLGERITAWLRARSGVTIVDKAVVMSSDNEFHCLTIIVFAQERFGSTPNAVDLTRVPAGSR